MAIAPYRYTLKRINMLWGSRGFCSVSPDNFFVVTYTCLSLVLTIDFCYSQLILLFLLFSLLSSLINIEILHAIVEELPITTFDKKQCQQA